MVFKIHYKNSINHVRVRNRSKKSWSKKFENEYEVLLETTKELGLDYKLTNHIQTIVKNCGMFKTKRIWTQTKKSSCLCSNIHVQIFTYNREKKIAREF